MLLALFCFLTWTLPALAAEQDEVPVVTFENEYNPNPDLFVSKRVENLDDRYPADPEAEFTFTLKLNGELARKRDYRLYDAEGRELFKDLDGEIRPDPMIKRKLETSRNGDFTLRSGWTAQFEYVGRGTHYEVTEHEREAFVQIVPAEGSSAAGTVTAEGASVQFVNQYGPPTVEEQFAELSVSKRISFPEGYELLPDARDFQFRLQLNGKPYGAEAYAVIDLETGETLGNGITDAEGGFSLDPGQKAVFKKVKAEQDYRIEELEKTGWRVVGEPVREGAVKAPATAVSYTNASAAFAVTKSLSDKTAPEDAEFTFQLTDQERNVWPGASYYLYEADGSLAPDAEHTTGAAGDFRLKPGQTAVFAGIEPGTIYHVSEKADPMYSQQVPLSPEGYTDKVVRETVEILPFVNEPAPEKLELTVTKQIEAAEGELPLEQGSFTFVLRKKNPAGSYDPLPGQIYSISREGSVYTYKTEQDGSFTLKANETARFDRLERGAVYQVEETGYGVEYEPKDGIKLFEAELTESRHLIFVNTYTARLIDLHLWKKDSSNNALENATFTLYADEGLTNEVGSYTSGANGEILIPDLKSGSYWLAETRAPEGFQLLANPIKIELSRTSDKKLIVKVDGKEYTSTNSSDDIYIVHAGGRGEKDQVHVTVRNYRNFQLPLTGGRGLLPVMGLALTGIGMLSLAVLRRRKRVK